MKTKWLLAVLIAGGFALTAQPVLTDDDDDGGAPFITDVFVDEDAGELVIDGLALSRRPKTPL